MVHYSNNCSIMFIKIITLSTSLFLILTLGYTIATRDFVLPFNTKVSGKIPVPETLEKGNLTFEIPISSPSNTVLANDPTESTSKNLNASTSSSMLVPSVTLQKKNAVKIPSTTPTITKALQPTQVRVQKVPDALPTTVYERLDTEYADNEVMYRPTVSPCTKTMGYKLGTFDTRFVISRATFLDEVAKASTLWGEAVNKTLFIYDEQGPLTINLIYDERQSRTEDVNNLAIEIENAKQSADAVHVAYEQEKVTYTHDTEEFTRDAESFRNRSSIYATKVASYNQAGGASQQDYDAMNQELALLKEDAKILDKRQVALTQYMEAVNARVKKYNELVVYINTLVKKSNALGAKKFTEGMFSSKNIIDIYQYNNTLKLRRVLAHEFGHALGINHNTNPFSIMYSANNGSTFFLSKEDLESLLTVCVY